MSNPLILSESVDTSTNQTLPTLLEELFQNITVSLMSSPELQYVQYIENTATVQANAIC